MDLKTDFIAEPTESSIICICTIYNEVVTSVWKLETKLAEIYE